MEPFSNKAEIDRIYAQLSLRADLEYAFITAGNAYFNRPRNYGTDMWINMVEVHTLTMIADHPGITVKELAHMWNRTKGAVSQNVAKLEQKGLITRRRSEVDARTVHIYATEEGERLSLAHKMSDNMTVMDTQQKLMRTCSVEEMDAFYKVLKAYVTLMEEDDQQ